MTVGPALSLLLCLLLPIAADARPLYAMRTGMSCARCHVDPAGGGIRTATGFKYALNGHTMAPAEEPTQTIEPKISDGLRLGADFRTQYLQDSIEEVSGDRSTFFLMQANLSVAADVSERVALVYSNDQGNTQEAFALMGGFPMEGTVKVGRFRPAFGIEEEDHTTFTRDSLGFGNNAEDVGIEVSVAKGSYHGNLAFMNGSRGGAVFDDNAQKAVLYRGRFYGERMGVGVSGYYNNPGFGDRAGKRRYLYGAFAHIHHGPIVLMGEYDRGANEYEKNSRESTRRKIEQAAAFAEACLRIGDRQTLRIKYDRYDHDLEYAENARDRIGVGLDADIFPFTRLLTFARGMREYGVTQGGERKYGSTRDSYQFLAQLYVGF